LLQLLARPLASPHARLCLLLPLLPVEIVECCVVVASCELLLLRLRPLKPLLQLLLQLLLLQLPSPRLLPRAPPRGHKAPRAPPGGWGAYHLRGAGALQPDIHTPRV
jgi:hypothetical protein